MKINISMILKMVFSIFLLAGVSQNLNAQEAQSSLLRESTQQVSQQKDISNELDILIEKLELKDLQSKNFKSTVLRYRSRMMGVHHRDGLTRQTKRSLLNDIQIESDKEIAMILSEDQFKIYKAAKIHMKPERLPPPGPEPSAPNSKKNIQLKNDK